jgi:hypothetical protein
MQRLPALQSIIVLLLLLLPPPLVCLLLLESIQRPLDPICLHQRHYFPGHHAGDIYRQEAQGYCSDRPMHSDRPMRQRKLWTLPPCHITIMLLLFLLLSLLWLLCVLLQNGTKISARQLCDVLCWKLQDRVKAC